MLAQLSPHGASYMLYHTALHCTKLAHTAAPCPPARNWCKLSTYGCHVLGLETLKAIVKPFRYGLIITPGGETGDVRVGQGRPWAWGSSAGLDLLWVAQAPAPRQPSSSSTTTHSTGWLRAPYAPRHSKAGSWILPTNMRAQGKCSFCHGERRFRTSSHIHSSK